MSDVRSRLLSQRPPARLEPVTFCGESLFVRVMTGAERDAFEQSRVIVDLETDDDGSRATARQNLANIRARLVVLVLADADGNRIFADADAEAVGGLDGLELDRVYQLGLKVNRLTKGAVEDAEKNSPPAPPASSGSGSP